MCNFIYGYTGIGVCSVIYWVVASLCEDKFDTDVIPYFRVCFDNCVYSGVVALQSVLDAMGNIWYSTISVGHTGDSITGNHDQEEEVAIANI